MMPLLNDSGLAAEVPQLAGVEIEVGRRVLSLAALRVYENRETRTSRVTA